MNLANGLEKFYNNSQVIQPKNEIVNGRFGKISVCFHTPTSKLFLIKTINNKNFNIDEIKIHQLMNHHVNFIKLYFYHGSLKEHTLVMEYVDCADLFELVQSRGELDIKRVKNIIRQLCCALNDLHATGFIHNDIKLENILYFDSLDRVYICDYGLCKRENQTSVRDGTLDYFSPEKINLQKYARSFDWYAVGVLTYKLLTGGRHPFEKKSDETLSVEKMKIRQQYYNIDTLRYIEHAQARDFVYSLTKFNLTSRLTNFKHIIKHDFLN
jgi:serine/threonine protein kinase